MATTVTMPQLGETVTEGTITQWFKQVGETVAMDEVLHVADQLEDLIAGNEIILARTKQIGVLPPEVAAFLGRPTQSEESPWLPLKALLDALDEATAAAEATLSESAWPSMGMRTTRSARSSQVWLSPYCSVPSTIAVPGRKSACV